MFDLEKVEFYSEELVTYRGHLPYYVLSVLNRENVKKRNDYLKGISDERYNNEREILKSERKSDDEKLKALLRFIYLNPKYKILIQRKYHKLFF